MPVPRMPDPATLMPEAMAALSALTEAEAGTALDPALLALCRLRTGQINGSGAGVLDGARRCRALGAAEDRVHAVAAWRDTAWFTEAERAALALTEAVTRVADRTDPVPDGVWDAAAKHFDQMELAVLVLRAAVANAVDRVTTATRQPPA